MDLRKDIYFYADLASFPTNGVGDVLYVDKATGLIYSWNGASYNPAGAGGLNYLGLWDANANSPAITSGVGTTGDYYIVGTAGTTNIDGISDWSVGDWIIFSDSAWQKIDNSDKVVSDGVTITGDGTVANPLVATGSSSSPTIQVVLFADLATTERLNPCTYNNGTLGVGATLTGNSNGQLSTISFVGRIDNVTTALNQTILVWQQVDQKQNGLYVVTQLGDGSNPFILTRSTDSDTQAEMYPLQINTYNGATLANRAFLQKTVDPVVGTNNIVFTTSTIGIQTSNLNFVDTVTSAALPSCTYTNGTNPTVPGVGARLTATSNGAIGTINGITLAVNNRILVKDQVNQAHNGDYSVTQVGSGSLPFILTRVSGWGGEFPRLVREWKVNNPSSTKYGARYSTNLTSLSNTNVGITAIPFFEVNTQAYTTIEDEGTPLTQRSTINFVGAGVTATDSGGKTVVTIPSGGLTYFTEAQNTTAPNATVPVDSLTAVSGATNADFAIVPKGTGALITAIPDNTTTGGNKRGTNAIDLQTTRTNADQVASGNNSIVIGSNSKASSSQAIAIGINAASTNTGIALNSNNNVAGANAVASGVGSIAINGGQASGNFSLAIFRGFATNQNTFAFGNFANATGSDSLAIGYVATASGDGSVALGGFGNNAAGRGSYAFGINANTFTNYGRQTYGVSNNVSGDAQKSLFILSRRTTDATLTALTIDSSPPVVYNQVLLQNQNAFRFKGSIIGKKSGTTDVAAWDIDGLIVRGANAASTTLVVGNVNLVSNAPVWGTPTLVADTTNGCLRVQVSGLAATNIQWTANIETTEVIYA